MDETRPAPVIPDRYIGDGVYVSFDGYHIWLDTRAQSPIHRIALEPRVLDELDSFRNDLKVAIKVKHERE